MKRTKFFLLLMLLVIPAIGASGQDDSRKSRVGSKLLTVKNGSASNSTADEAMKPATDDPNYSIGAEDELNVNVWKEPDISRTVPVRPDGKISLPLLNDVQAAGLTPMQLGSEIKEKLKKFLSEPQVTVIVTKINSQRVFIVGEVMRAGAYPLLPNMSVLQALSSAGGFTQFANQKKIHILRMENGKQISVRFSYKEVVSGHHPEQNISLRPGDTIVVP
jgi:polysaccharide export outer membrane protein